MTWLNEKLKKSASGISYLGTEDTPEAWSSCKGEHGWSCSRSWTDFIGKKVVGGGMAMER
jgi:hypothetical protein